MRHAEHIELALTADRAVLANEAILDAAVEEHQTRGRKCYSLGYLEQGADVGVSSIVMCFADQTEMRLVAAIGTKAMHDLG